jgi:hypothetical protein
MALKKECLRCNWLLLPHLHPQALSMTLCGTIYPRQNGSYCVLGMVEKLVRHQQDTCCFVGRLRTFGWRKVPLFPHSFRMHELLNQLVGLIGEKTPWQGSCCGAHDVHITWVLEWVDGAIYHLPQRDAYFLELIIPFFSMRKSGVKSKHEGEILMVQAKGFQPQCMMPTFWWPEQP